MSANAPSSTTTASNRPIRPTSNPPMAGSTTRICTGFPAPSATSSPSRSPTTISPASRPRDAMNVRGPTPCTFWVVNIACASDVSPNRYHHLSTAR